MPEAEPVGTVRDAAIEVLRERGLTTIFSNPGSTEVPFLADLPDDIDFVLALHEASVVGIATGHALASGRPALALLHTTAGLGNAVGAIATARVNRAPLVVVVGQQDRRHLALEPFLAGRLAGLAGDYPLEVIEPAWAADVPSAIARAAYRAEAGRGPVLVMVPMDDWDAPARSDSAAAPGRVVFSPKGLPTEVGEVAELLAGAESPAIVAGAGVDSGPGWEAVRRLSRRLTAPVFAEPFGSRAGFDQSDRSYAGQLPADRTRLRQVLGGHDVLLVVGTAALRQYPYETGSLVPDGTRVIVLSEDVAEATRSPAEIAVVGDPVALLEAIASRLPPGSAAREMAPREGETRETLPSSTGAAEKPTGTSELADPAYRGGLRPEDVFELLAAHLPPETILVEESPSSRPALQSMVPARRPMGFLSAAMGGLGFAMPAAIGIKMAQPGWPVLAVVGDGSSLYSIQSLWTAAHRRVGVAFIVLANGGYAVMDRLAERRGGKAPWPSFPEVSVSGLAAALGVETVRVRDHHALRETVASLCLELAARSEPLLVEVAVEPGETFKP